MLRENHYSTQIFRYLAPFFQIIPERPEIELNKSVMSAPRRAARPVDIRPSENGKRPLGVLLATAAPSLGVFIWDLETAGAPFFDVFGAVCGRARSVNVLQEWLEERSPSLSVRPTPYAGSRLRRFIGPAIVSPIRIRRRLVFIQTELFARISRFIKETLCRSGLSVLASAAEAESRYAIPHKLFTARNSTCQSFQIQFGSSVKPSASVLDRPGRF